MAATACKKGLVSANNIKCKPSREVYPMDHIKVRINQINYEFKILDLPKSRVAAKLVPIYRTDFTPKEAFQAQEKNRLLQNINRKKGEGRPTKKERRDLDHFFEEE
jgi:ribosome-associated heat shock protein Hsp15